MPTIFKLKDIHAPELDVYARLNEKQLTHIQEPDLGLFIAESPKVIFRALEAGYEPVSLLVEERYLSGKHAFSEHVSGFGNVTADEAEVTLSQKELSGSEKRLHAYEETEDLLDRLPESLPVYTADNDTLQKITGFSLTRGALCAMRRKNLPSVTELLQSSKSGKDVPRRIAILENVVNPTNVGAIFRSAAALGMDAILLTGACSDPLYRRSLRVSMGTVFQIPWTYLPSWPHPAMEELHQLGFKTASMALRDDTVDISDPVLHMEEKLAVILGTEGEGLGQQTIDDSDYTICIPMTHGVDSLNVAAASAVAFWELGSLKNSK